MNDIYPILITAIVILALLTSLIKDWARPHILFLGALLVLLVTGVLSPTEAFVGFANEAVFTVAALFVVAAGVQNARALHILDRLLFKDHISGRSMLWRMMSGTAIFSAFLNNTPIVAMLIPQVKAWAERRQLSPSRFLIPLSYAAIVGGTITLIGTSTNLIVSGMLRSEGMAPLGLFQLSIIGLPATILVIIWMYAVGYKWLPNHSNQKPVQPGVKKAYQFDLIVPGDALIVGKTIEHAGLRDLKNAFLLHIQRDEDIIGPVGPDWPIAAGDILSFAGDYLAVNSIAEAKKLKMAVPRQMNKANALPLYEAVLAHTSDMIGRSLKDLSFRERMGGVVIAIQRPEGHLRGALGNIPLKAGDLLLIEAGKTFQYDQLDGSTHFYTLSQKGVRHKADKRQQTIALLILIGMISIAGFGLMPLVSAALLAALFMLINGHIAMGQLLNAIQLPILLVIAASIGIGQAVEVSGMANYIADSLLSVSAVLGPLGLLLALYLATNALTELITNNAAAVLMMPIGIAAVQATGIHPHAAALCIAIAASASFLSPIGYQTNLMVMGAGQYTFKDYLKAGWPLSIILMGVTIGVVYWVYF